MKARRSTSRSGDAARSITAAELAALTAAAARLQAGLADLHDALARLRDPDHLPDAVRWPAGEAPDLADVGKAPTKGGARR